MEASSNNVSHPNPTQDETNESSILASWDAEEFGLMGSTEWVEDHLPELIEKTVAYINLDTAVSGPRAEIVGSGEIQTIAIETMKKIIFPEGYGAGPTLYDAWYNATEGVLPAMGSGSDYAAFYHNGITSVSVTEDLTGDVTDLLQLDIAGGPGPKDAVYAYHTYVFQWPCHESTDITQSLRYASLDE